MCTSWGRRFGLLLLNLFAAVALILAAAGVYGALSYSVARQTREIGIGMALGAERSRVLCEVLGRGMALVGLALALSLVLALGLGRFLEGLLFGVESTDPIAFVGSTAVLAAVSLLACLLPARRATAIDPGRALRQDQRSQEAQARSRASLRIPRSTTGGSAQVKQTRIEVG